MHFIAPPRATHRDDAPGSGFRALPRPGDFSLLVRAGRELACDMPSTRRRALRTVGGDAILLWVPSAAAPG